MENNENESNILLVEEATDDESLGASRDTDTFLTTSSLRIAYQTNNFFLDQIRDMMSESGKLNIRPDFQRRSRWSSDQKSKLIESLILNIPIPSIYLIEIDRAKYEVMDGQQRLTAIKEFFNGDFELTRLEFLKDLKGKKYKQLTPLVKITLERASISTILLQMESAKNLDSYAKSDDGHFKRLIFERLNTGSISLSAQEIRNALYPSLLNNATKELSRYNKFTEIFNIPSYSDSDLEVESNLKDLESNYTYKTMKDCELVLRFFAVKFAYRGEHNINGSLKNMLDRTLTSDIDEKTIRLESEKFKSRLEFLYKLFDGKPFQLEASIGKKTTIAVNLYDSLMVAIDDLWEHHELILRNKEGVQERLEEALKDEEDRRLYLTGKKTGIVAMRKRVDIAKSILLPRKE